MWPTDRLVDRTLLKTPHQQNEELIAEVKTAKVEHLRLTQELEQEQSRVQAYRANARTCATMVEEASNRLVQKVRAVINAAMRLRSWRL